MDVAPQKVSGRGTLYSFTLNYQPWTADFSGPFAVGLVELEEQPGLNITTSIVECALEDLRIGLPVEVLFHQLGEAWLPVFRLMK